MQIASRSELLTVCMSRSAHSNEHLVLTISADIAESGDTDPATTTDDEASNFFLRGRILTLSRSLSPSSC